jgi:hypothetical protein
MEVRVIVMVKKRVRWMTVKRIVPMVSKSKDSRSRRRL